MKNLICLIGFITLLVFASCSKNDGTPNIDPIIPPPDTSGSIESSIRIDGIDIENIDDDHIKIHIVPVVKNATITSYKIVLKNHPSKFIPVDFVQSGDSLFIEEEDGSNVGELLENGERDEDGKKGSFAYTFKTDYWAGGDYDIEVIVVAKSLDPNIDSTLITTKAFKLNIVEDIKGTWIKIYNFRMKKVGDQQAKVMFQARSNDVAIGSINIQLISSPNDDIPGIFESQAGVFYVREDGTANIPDNGHLDEDPREGHFAYTFDMSDWKDGDYLITFVATNRPASGNWIGAKQENVVFNKKMY